jgi:hypothetical protein
MVLAVAGGGLAAEVLTARFARRVLSGRWFTLFACLLILSASGATNAFGIYSRAATSVSPRGCSARWPRRGPCSPSAPP